MHLFLVFLGAQSFRCLLAQELSRRLGPGSPKGPLSALEVIRLADMAEQSLGFVETKGFVAFRKLFLGRRNHQTLSPQASFTSASFS